MKLLKIERPATKNLKIARILFMVMTVLFAALMCYLCIQNAKLKHFAMEVYNVYEKPADFQYSSEMPYEEYLRQYTHALTYFVFSILETVWYSLSGIAILLLCLRCSVATSCIAWGLSLAGALYAFTIDTQLNEYVFLKYHLFPFFSADTNLTILPYFKPAWIILLIAAAIYFLVARLIEHKKASAAVEEMQPDTE